MPGQNQNQNQKSQRRNPNQQPRANQTGQHIPQRNQQHPMTQNNMGGMGVRQTPINQRQQTTNPTVSQPVQQQTKRQIPRGGQQRMPQQQNLQQMRGTQYSQNPHQSSPYPNQTVQSFPNQTRDYRGTYPNTTGKPPYQSQEGYQQGTNIGYQQQQKQQNTPLATLKPGEVKQQENKPASIKTKRLTRNRIIIIIVTILALLGAAAYCYFVLDLFKPQAQLADSLIDKIETIDNGNIEYSSSQKNIASATEAIGNYYTALANNNAGYLHEQGWDAAANAIELGWLPALEYKIDITRLMPTKTDFLPNSVGTYAGCSLYAISDFYLEVPQGTISSIITGLTGPVGWIYYDPIKAHWQVVDPTIPTALYAPEATDVGRKSSDEQITTIMTSSGAFANPWWAYMALTVDITAPNMNTPVAIAQKQLDAGVTSQIPQSLLDGLKPVQNTQQQQQPTDPNQQQNANTNTITTQHLSTLPEGWVRASGIIIIQRGVLNNFSIDRIGQKAQQLDGNVVPITIQTPTEDITPVFLIGTNTTDEFIKLWNAQEMELYGTSPEAVEELRKQNMELGGNGNPTTRNSNSNTNTANSQSQENTNQNSSVANGQQEDSTQVMPSENMVIEDVNPIAN